MVRSKQHANGTTMITKNGNWWTPVAQTSGRPGDYLRDEYFPCVRPINIATELCTQRRNAIDVGTWIGDSTVHMASLFDRVIGFEPHPMCFVCCEKNLKARDIENTELYNIALSNVNWTYTRKIFITQIISRTSRGLSNRSPPISIFCYHCCAISILF